MHDYSELNRSLEDLASQAAVYRPTAFWADASVQIAYELREHAIEHLRSLPSAPFYFAPLYGPPTSGFMPDQVDAIRQWYRMQYPDSRKPTLAFAQFLAGETQAITD